MPLLTPHDATPFGHCRHTYLSQLLPHPSDTQSIGEYLLMMEKCGHEET